MLKIYKMVWSIRDIILDKTQTFYLKFLKKLVLFKQENYPLLNLYKIHQDILEGMGILLFVILLIYWSETRSETEFLIIFPTLAALAIGAQRILPLMNIIYTNLVFVKSNFYQLNEVENILTKNLYLEKQKKKFLKRI